MEKVSIARRRQRARLELAQEQLDLERPTYLRLEQFGRPSLQGTQPPQPQGQESPALGDLIAALKEGGAVGRRIGFALELELDPADPSRVKVELIPRPVSFGHYISVKQASRLLRVSPAAIRRALVKGQLPGIKIGRRWRLCLERPRRLEAGPVAAGGVSDVLGVLEA